MTFSVEELQPNVWKIVQDDPYRQYPFIYVILGPRRCFVIDTGCPVAPGKTSLRDFVDVNVNHSLLPYTVICTHVHFDHIGGNCAFCTPRETTSDASEPSPAFPAAEVLMSGRDRVFSQNIAINSLAPAQDVTVLPFEVTRWLEDGDVIPIGDGEGQQLQVIYTPGHTPDSLSLHYPAGGRVFVGDLLYPYTAVHIDCLGSNLKDYEASLGKLHSYLAPLCPALGEAGLEGDAAAAPLPPSAEVFLNTLGLTPDAVSRQFCVKSLMSICNDDPEAAVNMFLTSQEDVLAMCPPPAADSPPPAGDDSPSPVVLSCGHVEAALHPSSLRKVATLIRNARAGSLVPQSLDGDYAEYTDGTFSVVLSMKQLSAAQ